VPEVMVSKSQTHSQFTAALLQGAFLLLPEPALLARRLRYSTLCHPAYLIGALCELSEQNIDAVFQIRRGP
jgi:hypothetical protein